MTGATVEVIEAGLLTTVQDTVRRSASRRYGVSDGGAVDSAAARSANAIVGNRPDAAVLEITWDGPTLRFTAAASIAITGAVFEVSADGQSVRNDTAITLAADATVTFERLVSGARAYLAVRGGIDVPSVLGSRSTDVQSRFGGLDGRAVRAGDRLPIGDARAERVSESRHAAFSTAPRPDAPVRILPGPHLDQFDHDLLDALCAAPWTVSPRADRKGYRLDGAPLARGALTEIASFGLPHGAIQVPGDGRPIVLLADHQPTGGYPVPAIVIAADVGVVAQRLPGDEIRFQLVTHGEAVDALRAAMGPRLDSRRAAGEAGSGR